MTLGLLAVPNGEKIVTAHHHFTFAIYVNSDQIGEFFVKKSTLAGPTNVLWSYYRYWDTRDDQNTVINAKRAQRVVINLK